MSETVYFPTGEAMWDHYGNSIHYNPMVNVHFACNTRLDDYIKERTFDRTDEHNDLVEYARSFLMEVRIEDLFENNCYETVYANFTDDLAKIRKHHPDTPELWNLWDPADFMIDDMPKIIRKYIQLLDPYTMTWIHPQEAERNDNRQFNKYRFRRNPPIAVHDPHFLYVKDSIKSFEDHLRDDILEDIESFIPSSVYDILKAHQ